MGENSPPKEKGFVAALYAGIKRCPDEKHIHLQTKADYIDGLIKRAEPELNGNGSRHRERHAKTMEIAQEEVLTCIGMCIYERLRRIHMELKEEENACQVLAAVSVHCLCRSFDMAVEKKRGKSNLELLYEEISRAERAKEQRREQKKLKKKRKKNEKKGLASSCRGCNSTGATEEDEEEESHAVSNQADADDDEEFEPEEEMKHHSQVEKFKCQLADEDDGEEQDGDDEGSRGEMMCEQKAKKKKKGAKEAAGKREKKTIAVNNNNNNNSKDRGRGCLTGKGAEDIKDEISVTSCHSCENTCTQSIDGGYVSEPSNHEGTCSSILSSTAHSGVSSLSSTPEGSEVACSDGFCNHDPRTDDGRCHRGGSPEHNSKKDGRHSANVCGQPLSLQEMLVSSIFIYMFFFFCLYAFFYTKNTVRSRHFRLAQVREH